MKKAGSDKPLSKWDSFKEYEVKLVALHVCNEYEYEA